MKRGFNFFYPLQSAKYLYYVNWYKDMTLRDRNSEVGKWVYDNIQRIKEAMDSELQRIKDRPKVVNC